METLSYCQLMERCIALEAEVAELRGRKAVLVGWMIDVEIDELHCGIANEAYIYRFRDATSTVPLYTIAPNVGK